MARDRGAHSASRRIFCWTLTGVLVAPDIAIAQASKVPRIGWLQYGEPDTPEEQRLVDDALAEVVWIAGKNVILDRRYVSIDDLPRTAQEFVNAKVDLIVANGTPATRAAKNATSRIPILMWSAADPVAAGLVASLAQPGGNVTGYALLSPQLGVKRLSLLRELLPGIRRVAELDNSDNAGVRVVRKQLEEAYQSVGMEPIFIDIARVEKFDDLIAEAVRRRAQALSIREYAFSDRAVAHFAAAIRASLPTIAGDYEFLEAGALLSYEIDPGELLRRDAVLFERLLRGAKPADLPVEQPAKFVLGINLRTARALGITIPQSLLQRADKVIQ